MARSCLPPGFRFHPTDEELLVHYLKKKVGGRRVGDGVIGEIEFYKFEPADLPGLATLHSRDPEWFFFNAQDKKYLHGARTNRTTGAGYWKATGKDRKISAGSCTGLKKTLIYYSGRAPHGKRTDWIMHEYRLDEEFEKKMNCAKSFVLCRVRRKGGLGPRNGEQYGAPVLETSEENECGPSTSYPLEEACALSSPDTKIVKGQVLEIPHVGVSWTERAGDDIDSFLQTLISYEEQEQQAGQDEVLSFEEMLGLVDNVSDFAVMEPGTTDVMGLGFGDMEDNLCDMLHPADNESAILEDMLRQISGQVEIPDGLNGRRVLQEPSYEQALDDVDNAGFIEIADLEEPCDEQGTVEWCDVEELLYELENGVEIPMRARLAQERLHGQSSRGLQHLEGHNEQLAQAVLLDSSQGLSVLDRVYSRSLTSDDGGGFSDDLPSGFILNSDQEEGFAGNSTSSVAHSHSHSSRADESSEAAHSHSHSSRADKSSEAQLVRVDNIPGGVNRDMQGAVASISPEETKVALGEHVSPSPSSPSSFARVISGFLSKVNVLPASAAELPVELDYFAAESEIAQSALTHCSSSSISGASLHFRVKLIDLEHTARTPEMELQLSVSRTVSEQVSTKPCRNFTTGLSVFLFRITTLALILLCMFRGFCRSTRTAIL